MFLEPGLAKKVSLCTDYAYTNSFVYTNKGTRYMLCYSILKKDKQTCTTKGYQICRVSLCSSPNIKFKDPKESCEYRWHYVDDLESLKQVSTKKWSLTGIVKGVVDKNSGYPFKY